jgi:galactonate dehydratase
VKHNSRRSFLTRGAMSAAAALAAPPMASFGAQLETAVDRAPQASRPSDLRITAVKVAYLRGGASLFVKIETNQGLTGWGEGVDAVNGAYNLAKSLGQRLVRRNPLDVHRIFEDLRKGGIFGGAQAGMFIAVLSAIETALWDVSGKALGVPVYRLLGGKFRDRVRVYMDTALYQSRLPTPDDFGKAAKEAVDMGMTAVKFDLDQANDPGKYDAANWTASQSELQRMVDQVAAARKAVGPKIDICCDMHGRYDLPTGKKVAELLEPYNLMWLEEPVPAENIDALKQINDSSSTPICAGENLYLGHGFRRALEIGAVDMIMPDLQKAGGLGEGQRIANLAHLYYVPFAPHMVASYLGAMASAHVCASVPNFMILEWQVYFHRDKMYTDIVHWDGPMVKDGYIPLSEKPGIGVDINEEGLKRYAAQGIPFFE